MGDERSRLHALEGLAVLETSPEQAYDDITRYAASAFGAPIALVSLVDGTRQWFKSRLGLQAAETPREHSFCTHAIEDPSRVMVVNDTTKDERFAANPLVSGEPSIRFYAGAPLVTSEGHALGTLCVIDTVPREVTPEQLQELQFLSRQVIQLLEARAAVLPKA